jgi:hypothetical protein
VKSLPSKTRIFEKRERERKKKKREKGREKERSKDWKEKEVKPHMKKLLVSKGEKKKKRMNFTNCWERFYQKKERKKITFSYTAKSEVSLPTHHLHLHYLLFLDFSLYYRYSLHHSLSTMIICHTNSLEFSFAFTIYKLWEMGKVR